MPPDPTSPTYLSIRDLATVLAGRRINASPSTLSRWSQDGGPWGFPPPDQRTAATPLWRRDRIEAWADRYARLQHLGGYRLAELLRTYAAAGAAHRPAAAAAPPDPAAAPRHGPPALTADLRADLARLLAAHRTRESVLRDDFNQLVRASEARLGVEPLLLPALANLIPAEDENAVSDVLAEMLKLLPKSAAFDVFGLQPRRAGAHRPEQVEREWLVAEGHEGQTGRLDLVAIYPDGEWLVIETKVVTANAADLAKNAGYARSLTKAGVALRAVCLVLGGAATAEGHGFVLANWRDALLRFRAVVAGLRREAALSEPHSVLCLALVGLLEGRLLNLRLDARLSDPTTRTYLHDFHTGTPA